MALKTMASPTCVILVVLFALATTASCTEVNAYTLGYASFKGGRINFKQDMEWVLHIDGQQPKPLRLSGRSAHAVYLCGGTGKEGAPRRKVEILLKEKLVVDHTKEKLEKRHAIISMDVEPINGRNLGRVSYCSSFFKYVKPHHWTWVARWTKATLEFSEVKREAWIVTLLEKIGDDNKDPLRVRVNLHLKIIEFFSCPSNSTPELVKITGTKHSMISYRLPCGMHSSKLVE